MIRMMCKKSLSCLVLAVFVWTMSVGGTLRAGEARSVDAVTMNSNSALEFDASITLSGPVDYKVDTVDSPSRVMVSFQNLPSSSLPAKQEMASTGVVKSVRAFYVKPGELNALIFDLEKPGKVNVSREGNALKLSMAVTEGQASSVTGDAVKSTVAAAPAATDVSSPAVVSSSDPKELKKQRAKEEREARKRAKEKAKLEQQREREERRVDREMAKAKMGGAAGAAAAEAVAGNSEKSAKKAAAAAAGKSSGKSAEPASAEKTSSPETKAPAADSAASLPAPAVMTASALQAQAENKPKEVVNNTSLSLDECMQIALRNNEKIKIALEEMMLAKMKVDDARRGLWPKMLLKEEETGGKTTADFVGRHASAEVQVPLYTGGKLRNTLRQSRINLAVALMNFKREKNEFVAGLAEGYFSLASAKERVAIKTQLVKDADVGLEEMKKRQQIGSVRDLELMDMQVQHMEIKSELEVVQHDAELARTSLIHLMGVDESSTIDVPAIPEFKPCKLDFQPLLKIAMNNRIDIRTNQLLVKFHAYGVEIAKSEGRFTADASGSVGFGDEYYKSEGADYRSEWFAGVKFAKTLGLHKFEDNLMAQDKVPAAGQTTSTRYWMNTAQLTLFSNNSFVNVKEAKIKYQKAIDEYKRSQNTGYLEVRKAFFEYQRSIDSLESFKLKLQYGQKELEVTKAQKDVNQAVISDVLKVQGRLSTTQADFVKARENAFVAAFKLNKELGVVGYVDPFSGSLREELAAKPRDDAAGAEQESSWYQFWTTGKAEKSSWSKKYPEIDESAQMIAERKPHQVKGYHFGYKHDYRLLFIDEPISDDDLRKLQKRERKAQAKADKKARKEELRRQKEIKKEQKSSSKKVAAAPAPAAAPVTVAAAPATPAATPASEKAMDEAAAKALIGQAETKTEAVAK